MREQGITERVVVRAGFCHAWSLPADETCAGAARRIFRNAVAGIALEPGVHDDAVLMASELAANTLHASAAALAETMLAEEGDGRAAGPELWLYLRGVGLARELVCKVFDSYRGWLNGPPPESFDGTADCGERGRGLRIVSELSCGRWGHHPTRARLAQRAGERGSGGRPEGGRRGMRGKAVWFAVPAPMAHPRLVDVTGLRVYTRSVDVTADREHGRISPRHAAGELTRMFIERGFGRSVFSRSDDVDDDVSVLALRHGLTLWCRPGTVTLTAPASKPQRWDYTDLVDAVEETICRFEQLAEDRSRELVIA